MAREALSGKILFLGWPLDTDVRDVKPWRKSLTIPWEGEHHVYRLERVRSAGYRAPANPR